MIIMISLFLIRVRGGFDCTTEVLHEIALLSICAGSFRSLSHHTWYLSILVHRHNIRRLHLFTILQGNCVGGGAKDWHHFHIVWHNSKIHTLKKSSWQFLFQTPTRLSIWRTCSKTSTKLSWCWNMLQVDAYFSSLSLSNTHQQHSKYRHFKVFIWRRYKQIDWE